MWPSPYQTKSRERHSGGDGSMACRCCVYGRSMRRFLQPADPAHQRQEIEPPGVTDSIANFPHGSSEVDNKPAANDPATFLFGPPGDEKGELPTTKEQRQTEAANAAVTAVVPLMAGVVATSVAAAALSAACPLLLGAAGTHSLAAVATGTFFAALSGLAASAYSSVHLCRQEGNP